MSTTTATCVCGHPADAHLLVDGFECSQGVTINGQSVIPDVWVCSGVVLADVLDPGFSPWDQVCGCVLHSDPSNQKRGSE